MALKNPVRLGDAHQCPKSGSTAHGQGKVVSGQSCALFDGMPVACVGDLVQCADGSTATILEGNACVKINGKRVALVGDQTDHGGALLSGASDIWIEEGEVFVEWNGKIAVRSGTYFICDENRHEAMVITPVSLALREAIQKENVPDDWYEDLHWIMMKESGGKAGIHCADPKSSARGLFQLNRMNYGFNPNGEASFGNATEEAQGGIRYIQQRYKTAVAARKFWEAHSWY